MSSPAYPTTVSVPGTSTVFADLPTNIVVAQLQYQLTDSTKRRLDPAVAVVVQIDADGSGTDWTAPAGAYTIDYVFGQVTFASAQGAGGCTCRFHSGNYLPVQLVGGANEFTLTVSRDMLENTAFSAGGAKSRAAGLHNASVSVSAFNQLNLNPITGVQSLTSLRDAGTPLLVEINPAGVGTFWRGWMLISDTEEKGQAASLYEGTVKFESAPVLGAGAGGNQTNFGWGT